MKPSEDVHGDRMLVAEVALQDVQRLDEVVACVDFVAAGFLKLGEITEGVAERRVIRVQFLFSQIDCFRIKAFGLFQLLPALMLRTLLEEVGDLGERGALRALLGKLFSQLGYLFDVWMVKIEMAAFCTISGSSALLSQRESLVRSLTAFAHHQIKRSPSKRTINYRERRVSWRRCVRSEDACGNELDEKFLFD